MGTVYLIFPSNATTATFKTEMAVLHNARLKKVLSVLMMALSQSARNDVEME